jgi:hypothetical protein
MALTPEIRASQAQVFAITEGNDLRLSQAQVLAVINFPTEEIRVSQFQVLSVLKPSLDIRVSQAQVFAVVRGRIDNTRMRAWTFTLDGHDFYVLRLGETGTLVYDTYSKQWTEWDGHDLPYWRTNVGQNWLGGVEHAEEYGSTVLVGDDTYGLLWLLDPNSGLDNHPDGISDDEPFPRIVMGQVNSRKVRAIPCNEIILLADKGDPAYIGATITLSTSDDAGNTFADHGTVTATLADFTTPYRWASLGQIVSPGRLFKIEDDGAIARIDALEMNPEDD